jgi:hypothetical protein
MDVESFISNKRNYTFQYNEHRKLVNSSGYFDDEFVQERPANGEKEIRVALFADSFGAQYYLPEKLFPNGAEKLLNDQGEANLQWNIMNFSMSGFGPREYVYLIEKEARFYEPDLYVICFFTGNDIYDTYLRTEASDSMLNPGRWYFYSVPWKLHRIYRERKNIKKENSNAPIGALGQLNPDEPGAAVFSEKSYLLRELFAQHQGEDAVGGVEIAFAEVEKHFIRANKITKGRLMVMIIPTFAQVNMEYYEREMLKHGMEEDLSKNYDSIELIKRICQENNIDYFDPTAKLQLAENQRRTYIVNDIHWNEHGQSIAANVLAEKLMNWLKAQQKETTDKQSP